MTHQLIRPWTLAFFAVCWGALGDPGAARLSAAVIFGNRDLAYGSRWDAAQRVFDGNERSLDGGLRFSLQGGSYANFRNLLTWAGGPPSVAAIESAIRQAFDAWTVADPVAFLGTALHFVEDLATDVVGPPPGERVDARGAEIDLLAAPDGFLWDPGNARLRAEAFFDSSRFTTVQLTSGTQDYPGYAIRGADIKFNNSPQARWDLTSFQTVLTHEIGHAIGLGDVDTSDALGRFIDDNYDASTSATAFASLTNPWSHLVDPANPAASPLALWTVANGSPGVDTPGVDILMESAIPESLMGLVSPLQNDDFGGRQFLYPAWPPSVLLGDMNHSGATGVDDIQAFVDALADPEAYADRYGEPPVNRGDTDADGEFDFDDIDGFVSLLADDATDGRRVAHVPEPDTTTLLAALAAAILLGLAPRWSQAQPSHYRTALRTSIDRDTGRG